MRSFQARFVLATAIGACIALSSVSTAVAETGASSKRKEPFLKVKKSQSKVLYDIAFTRFQTHFSQPSLKADIAKLAAGQATVSPELATRLKVTRLSANILRSTFIMVDKTHKKPEALHRYVVLAGRLNDAITANNYKVIPNLAKSVLAAMDAPALKTEVRGFRPASARSVNGYLQSSLRAVERGLASKTVTAPVFHQMRKDITYVQSLFNRGKSLGIGAPKHMDAKTAQLWNRLDRIRNRMGDLHDKLAAKKIQGKINYDTTQVKIPKDVRRDIKSVLKTLRASSKNHAKHARRWRQNVSPGKRPQLPKRLKKAKKVRAKVR